MMLSWNFDTGRVVLEEHRIKRSSFWEGGMRPTQAAKPVKPSQSLKIGENEKI